MKFENIKNEHAIEEIRNAIKRIERDNSLKTLLIVGLSIAAVFAVIVFLILKIKDKSAKKKIFDSADGYYFDDDDDVDFSDYSLFDDDDDFEYYPEDYDDMEDMSFDDDLDDIDLGDE